MAKLYLSDNTTPSVYTSTLVGTSNYDQGGGRLDLHRTEADSYFLRYSYFTGLNINQIPVRGSDLPGFPTRDDFAVHSAVLGKTHLFGARTSNNVQGSFFRYGFPFDQRLNQNGPRTFGFNDDSASAIAQGPPFFNLAGYSPVGGAITGPRTSVQNTYKLSDTVSVSRGPHLIRFGGDFVRSQFNLFQSVAPKGFFVFASSFPTNDAFANLLPKAKPSNAQTWNFGVQQELGAKLVLEVRYVGTKGTHLPRNIEANPAVYGPGATASNADCMQIADQIADRATSRLWATSLMVRTRTTMRCRLQSRGASNMALS